MFNKKKLRDDLPPIDITKKPVKGIFGNTKWISTSKSDQRKMKKELMKEYPDRYFLDELQEWNSIDYDPLSWIDDYEEIDIIFDDDEE